MRTPLEFSQGASVPGPSCFQALHLAGGGGSPHCVGLAWPPHPHPTLPAGFAEPTLGGREARNNFLAAYQQQPSRSRAAQLPGVVAPHPQSPQHSAAPEEAIESGGISLTGQGLHLPHLSKP